MKLIKLHSFTERTRIHRFEGSRGACFVISAFPFAKYSAVLCVLPMQDLIYIQEVDPIFRTESVAAMNSAQLSNRYVENIAEISHLN